MNTPRRVWTSAAIQRLVAEFVVIVVGVLVAFGVDDWQAERERRAAAVRLLGTMEADIAASIEDLEEAQRSASVRASALAELSRLVGEEPPGAHAVRPWADLPDEAVREGFPQRLVPEGEFRKLLYVPSYVQVFDPRTAAFDEFRSTGALATIPDQALRDDIVEFFAGILDFAESNGVFRAEQRSFVDAWQRAGVTPGDWLPGEEVVRRLTTSPEARAAVRRAFQVAIEQRISYELFSDDMARRGSQLLDRARAALRN